jgi:hypothetical protein
MMPNIKFLGDGTHDKMSNTVSFLALVDSRQIKCMVSVAALRDRFGMPHLDDPIPYFNDNRSRIEEIAANLITHDRFEKDGTILIKTTDI